MVDMDPIPPEKRTWGGLDYWAYWCSDLLAPPLASTVSSVMALGFTARETVPIVFFGFTMCGVVITLTGKMGATYAVPFPVIVRSVFGMYGSFPAICVRAFVAAMWCAILTVQASNFLQRCIEAIWPSFITFPNHLPESAGIDCKSQCLIRCWEILNDNSCWASLLVPILVPSNCSSPYANFKAAGSVLDQGYYSPTNLPCLIHMGCCHHKRVSVSFYRNNVTC